MFSTAQLDMLEPMVQAMYEDGYIYYVVHTNTNLNTSNYNNYDFYDLTFYFSKEPITFNNYKFTCSGNVIKINGMSRNVSNTTSDSKLSRTVYSSLSSLNVTVEDYEHIYSNADNCYIGDLMALTEYSNNNNIAYNISTNDFYVIPVLICIVIILNWFKVWFARNYKKGVSND